jgi:hypothetical protein
MRWLGCALWLVACSAWGVEPASFRAGGLEVQLDAQGRWQGLSVEQKSLAVRPAPLATLYEVERKTWHEPRRSYGQSPNEVRLGFPAAGVDASLTISDRRGALRVHCELQGAAGPARGFLLRFAVPVSAVGWQWHRDMQTAVRIEPGRVYENVVPLRAWADLPEFKDQPSLRMGYSDRNFCTVLSGPVGLCLAVPIDRPCIFRTAYDSRTEGGSLQLVYDFALSPDTRRPNQVTFDFDLYACDPRWGMRAALARYYELCPELFRNYVKQPGQWMAFSRLSEIDNANELYFALQEGAPEADYDDRLGVLSTTYFTHAGQGANVPNYDPEKDPLPPYETQVQAVEAAFKRTTGMDGVYQQVGLFDATGRFDIRRWTAYAHLIAQFNLDPELAYGKWTLGRARAMLDEFEHKRHAHLDGFYYDGLSSGINYRPDHFRTADAPCLWDPVAKKPLVNNFFSSCEFARAAAELMRPLGRITMMNGAMGASFYVAPWLDVLGSETGLRIPRAEFNYIRSITYRKPFLTLLKGNYEQKLGRSEIELYMKRCLAFGVFPGFFDWPTSGLGPGGRYWDHPRYFERDRDLFRKYQPLCRALAHAGWEPITEATSSEPAVVVERFGRGSAGLVWLSVINEQAQPHRTTLTLDAAKLGLPADAQVEELVAGGRLQLRGTQGKLKGDFRTSDPSPPAPLPQGARGAVDLELPADEVRLLAVGSAAELAAWHLGEALDVLDRGVAMRQLDAGRPARAVHWLPGRGGYGRETAGGQHHLVFGGPGRSAGETSQWVMLFQTKPQGLTLRVRAKAEGLKFSRGGCGVACRMAWVTRSFSHYQPETFALPEGTYDWRDFEFKLSPSEALRAVHVRPFLTSAKGTLHLAKISLVDAEGQEHAVDPDFREWYEPLPADLSGVERSMAAIRAGLAELQAAAQAAKPIKADTVVRACDDLTRQIRVQQAENSLRRVLRDLETIRGHVGR